MILSQLFELDACREKVITYEEFVAKLEEQFKQEKLNWEELLGVERQRTASAVETNATTMKRLDIAEEKAKFYEEAYRAVTKKKSFWCRARKYLFLGLWPCI